MIINKNHVKLFCSIAILFVSNQLFAVSTNNLDISDTIPTDIPQNIINDWKLSDSVKDDYQTAIDKIKNTLPEEYRSKVTNGSTQKEYVIACHWRRVARMEKYKKELKKILFARHHDLGGPILGFLEEMQPDGFTSNMGKWGGVSAESRSTFYRPGSALCMLQFDDCYPKAISVLEDKQGVLRDPCPSFDGSKLVFAWSKDNNGYHLWETEVDNPVKMRQLTDDPESLTVSDFEPCYLQNGDIIFNSSRCYGFVECFNNITSNLYIINKDGKYLRRLCYDQVHDFHPVLMDDGKVLYSRWEYNDRNVLTCFSLFTMNPDGSQQIEHYGNQTEWPATFIHARQIPGSKQIMSVISGHKAPYAGDLVIIDPNETRNGEKGVKLIAPLRENPKITSVNASGNIERFCFQNPFPFDNQWFLVSWRKNNNDKFAIYFMNINGERELLAWDSLQSLSQPISLLPRDPPFLPSYITNYSKTKSSVSVHNAYYGYGTGEQVAPGTIKKIRVIALDYRTDPAFGNTGSQQFQMTPIGRWTSSWEAKRIIGEVMVDENGAASFEVPPRTPLYLQLIDSLGCMIQTMRSWMTLQPGETFSCFGCHEDKNEAPKLDALPLTFNNTQKLSSFYNLDSTGYFSFPLYIQPILNKNCVKSGCHDATHSALDLRGDSIWTGVLDADNKNACRYWRRSYINLTDPKKNYLSYIDLNTSAKGLSPNSIGSQKSPLLSMLRKGHHDCSLTNEEYEKIAAWIDLCIPHGGSYVDDMQEGDAAKYRMRLERRKKHEALEERNIKEFIDAGGYKAYEYSNSVIKNRRNSEFEHGQRQAEKKVFNALYNSDTKTLSISTLFYNCSIRVFDLKGRSLLHKIVISPNKVQNNHTFTISLPNGIYVVKFKNTTSQQEKIITVY